MATQDSRSSERRGRRQPTPVDQTKPRGTRDERGRFRQGHANLRAGRPKGSKDRIPRDFKRMIADMIAGTIQEDEEISLLDLWYTALRTGLQAPPPYSIGYVKLVAEIGRAKDKGGVGRGLTIVLRAVRCGAPARRRPSTESGGARRLDRRDWVPERDDEVEAVLPRGHGFREQTRGHDQPRHANGVRGVRQPPGQ
jgi:hypothetical protein